MPLWFISSPCGRIASLHHDVGGLTTLAQQQGDLAQLDYLEAGHLLVNWRDSCSFTESSVPWEMNLVSTSGLMRMLRSVMWAMSLSPYVSSPRQAAIITATPDERTGEPISASSPARPP
jgi:hypothetical protein